MWLFTVLISFQASAIEPGSGSSHSNEIKKIFRKVTITEVELTYFKHTMKYKSKNKFKIRLFAFVLLFPALKSWSQAEFKNWNSAQLNLSVTKKIDLKFSHLRAFDITHGYKSDFNQSSVQLSCDLTKKTNIAVGYTVNGAGSLTDGGNRISARFGYKVNLADILTWSNSIQGEMHSKTETRYHYRVIWNTRISPKKRFDLLNLSPSVSYSLFYNIGGDPIQYYDKTGGRAARQTPDGGV